MLDMQFTNTDRIILRWSVWFFGCIQTESAMELCRLSSSTNHTIQSIWIWIIREWEWWKWECWKCWWTQLVQFVWWLNPIETSLPKVEGSQCVFMIQKFRYSIEFELIFCLIFSLFAVDGRVFVHRKCAWVRTIFVAFSIILLIFPFLFCKSSSKSGKWLRAIR